MIIVMKSIFLFLCFLVLSLTSQSQEFPRLDLSPNGTEIILDGSEEYFLMRARVEQTFQAGEALSQLNACLEELSWTWLEAVHFEMESLSTLEGSFLFAVEPNQDTVVRRCVFPSFLNNSYLEILQYPEGVVPQVYTLSGGGQCYYPGRMVPLELSGSEEGVSYELFRGSTQVSTLSGTGEALTFQVTNTGTYTVRAVRNGVSRLMNGSAVVSEYSIFHGRLSLINRSPFAVYPDGDFAEIPFSFTGDAGDIFPTLQEVANSCNRGESLLWNSSFLLFCLQTGTNTGNLIVMCGPNLRDTVLES